MAGLKAAIKWFSRERLPAGNGMFIMCGVLGAFAATVPAEFLLRFVSWRGLSAILRVATCLVALLVWRIVPDTARASAQAEKPMRLRDVVRDPMFRRFAISCSAASRRCLHPALGPSWPSKVSGRGLGLRM